MTITFEEYIQSEASGSGRARIALRASGAGTGIAGGIGRATLVLAARGIGQGGSTGEIAPAWPGTGGASINLAASGTGYGHGEGQGTATLQLTARGYGVAAGQGAGRAALRLLPRGFESAPRYGVLAVEQAPHASMIGDLWFVGVQDQVALGAAGQLRPTLVMRASIALNAAARQRSESRASAADVLVFGDATAFVLRMLVDDGLVLGDLSSATGTRIARIVSRLLASGRAAGYVEATGLVADALVLGMVAWGMQIGTIDEQMVLAAGAEHYAQALAYLLDSVVLADAGGAEHTLTVVINEQLLLAAAAGGQVDMVAVIRDAVGLAMNLSLDTGDYIAWTMQADTKGATTYTHYPFNSFFELDGTYYGVASDGVYQLGGDTDDGEKIHARLRLGLHDLGTRLLKRMSEAFIGYTSDGTLLLRVITVDEQTGEKVAAVYKLAPRAAGAKRENRFRVGRGLKAVDWDVEIENIDGADFSFDQIQFVPLVMSRRTRG